MCRPLAQRVCKQYDKLKAMDPLPKNQPNDSGDIASISGSYPQEKTAPAFGAEKPPTEPPLPPIGEETPVVTPGVENPLASQLPEMASGPVSPPASEASPFASPVTSEPPLPPPPPSTADNPFTIRADVAPTASGGGSNVKRLIAIAILIVALLAIGFVAFTVVGKLLTQQQPVVLQYWGLWENDQVLTPIIEAYQQSHPNIQIVYSRQSPRQYRETLQARIGRGEGPDIFRFHNTWVPMLREELAPAGKTGYTPAEFQQTFYPVMSRDLVVGEQVYGVPLMIDGLGLYYNEDLLRSAGVTPPTTWEEFRQAASQLTVKDETNRIVTAGAALGAANNIEHFSDILAVMMMQNGVDLNNPISVEAEQALSFYRFFADPPANTWDETLDNSILAFASGKVAFIFAPSWQVFTIRDLNPQLKFQVIPIPQLPGTNVAWASYWVEGVSQKSEHQEEAWEFLKYLSSKEAMIQLYTEEAKLRSFGEPYSRVDLAQTISNDPFVGAYVRQAPIAQSFFLASRTFDNGINDRMIKYLEDAVNSQAQGVSPAGALGTMTQGFTQVMQSFTAPTR